jgi:hypothetical protein
MREAWTEGVAMGAMLAVANDDAGLRRLYDGEREATSFRLVYGALLVRMSLCLTSLWNRPCDNRASVPTVAGLIADPDVRRLLRQDAFEWFRP